MTQAQIAATIAYANATYAERMVMAEVFADALRLTGKRRMRFIFECHRESEKQYAEAV
jgi:hypothetical protein